MSLEAILEHILAQAGGEKEKVLQEAKEAAQEMIRQAQKEAQALEREILEKEKAGLIKQKEKLLVSGRLEAKKDLLKIKQELVETVFNGLKSGLKKEKFKQELVTYQGRQEIAADIDFYLNQLRLEQEAEVANILFR